MKNYAVISGSTVINVISAQDLESAELATKSSCVEYTEENPAGIGWTYDGKKFIAPTPPVENVEG
ncbi:hypothetical protein UFOVP1662_5 [uncultured Caudovirales phage]|uniref:Uncharacterized protein n=1 Tax=uncultured Caudovirales phage TaxID=2100421 RepID=A0A6J5QIE2_9CAUD|nr:hypothetical protein UFOVP883_6 [uncultured Caudovirales phage]CAB4180332.1 hypothetical protein UFOVP1050_23 [uncultured Caudovirales phage]CAB4181181.1 hypothetical protein UFOVP1059_21 [uncultured Caudovirales phage]CAB4194966.1 hypothetical protein UFOVP1274_16 [uncultured Caudovirales phage]CAB4222917.1 hypothetical protein UFOVP1662_5 [uncultured Caudovirales phage]